MNDTTPMGPLRVLVIVCGEPEPSVRQAHGVYMDWFRQGLGAGVELRERDARREPLGSAVLDELDALIVSGSPHSVYEPLPWIGALEALVREAVRVRQLPMLGVCFGHQILAQACGGRVVRNPRGREIGTIEVRQRPAGTVSALLGGLPARFAAQATHCDTVASPPPDAIVLADNAMDDCQAFVCGSGWGVQFHPEFSAAVIRAYLEARWARLLEEGMDPAALHAAVRDTPVGREILSRFVALATVMRQARGTAPDATFAPAPDWHPAPSPEPALY